MCCISFLDANLLQTRSRCVSLLLTNKHVRRHQLSLTVAQSHTKHKQQHSSPITIEGRRQSRCDFAAAAAVAGTGIRILAFSLGRA